MTPDAATVTRTRSFLPLFANRFTLTLIFRVTEAPAARLRMRIGFTRLASFFGTAALRVISAAATGPTFEIRAVTFSFLPS